FSHYRPCRLLEAVLITFLLCLELAAATATTGQALIVIGRAGSDTALAGATGTLATALVFIGAVPTTLLFLLARSSSRGRSRRRALDHRIRSSGSCCRLCRRGCLHPGFSLGGLLGRSTSGFLGLACFLFLSPATGFGSGLTRLLGRTQFLQLAPTPGSPIHLVTLDVGALLAHFDVDRLAASDLQGADCLALQGNLLRLVAAFPVGILQVRQQALLFLVGNSLLGTCVRQPCFLHLL